MSKRTILIWRDGLAALNSSSAFMMPAARCSDQFWPGALTPTTRCNGPSFGRRRDLSVAKRKAGGEQVLPNERLPGLLGGALVASTLTPMTVIPCFRASWSRDVKALLSTIEVMSVSGLPAIAACMLAACCSIDPSVWVKIIWQSA